jgi:hypothetical protein
MLAVPNVLEVPDTSVFRDGLGERHVANDPTGELVQVLRLPEAAMALPDFEFALRERTARLSALRHASYAGVCRVDRFRVPALRFALVSEYVPGPRLSDLLRVAQQRDVIIDIAAALSLVRQLLAATAMLHEYAPDVANGLIAPERLIVTPQARIAIAEQALCTAIEQLRCSPDQLWRKYRIAAEPGSAPVRFSHRTDVLSIGLVALSLILGRPLADDDFPARLPTLLESARERSPLGYDRPLSSGLRDWLTRALQLDSSRLFASPSEAWIAFEKATAADPVYLATTVAIEVLLHNCGMGAHHSTMPAGPSPRRLASASPSLQPRPRPVPTVAAPAAQLKPTVPSVLTDPEIRTTMLPVDHVVGAVPSAPEPDPIDWSGITAQPAAVATANDITQLFSDGARPSTGDQASLARQVAPPPSSPDSTAPLVGAVVQGKDAGLLEPMGRPGDGLMFEPDWAEQTLPPVKRQWVRRTAIAAAVAGVLAGGAGVTRFVRPAVVVASEIGTLRIDSNPPALQVLVDGIEHGRTPTTLSVAAGAHVLEVRGGNAPRVMSINVAGGVENTQYVEFAKLPQSAQLHGESAGAGAAAVVDAGAARTPLLTVTDRAPDAREVVPTATGSNTTVAPPTWGWIAVTAPFPADVRADGKVLGTVGARIRMAAGRHEIELVNEARGYRSVRVVNVVPEKVTSVSIETPAPGLVNVNALPWAEVWIGGRRIGETPLANVAIPAGQHEVVFRHPQLGEKRQALRVSPGGRTRLSIDMK